MILVAIAVVVTAAVCVYGVAMGFAPVTAANLGSPEFNVPSRPFDFDVDSAITAFKGAAATITGLDATRVGARCLVIDCRPSLFRLDDGFGLVAVLRFDGDNERTTVAMSGRRKAKVDSRWRAQRGLTELERELRLLVKRTTGLKAIS